jgi:hypothetical protein
MNTNLPKTSSVEQFSGTIYFFHAFDIGEDINFNKLRTFEEVSITPLTIPKYFKNYHTPLGIALPHPHTSPRCVSVKLHSFGALSLVYKMAYSETLHDVRKDFNEWVDTFEEQSILDAKSIFKQIEGAISKPKFFETRSSYVLIQVNPEPEKLDLKEFQARYNHIIASTLRFETEVLSEDQTKEILESAVGYFKDERIIIDTDVAFAYEDPTGYEEILDLLEFANIQRLELQYFDRTLDQQLNKFYERQIKKLPLTAYIPLLSALSPNPIEILGQLKVDISVIAERLENTIKLSGEPYFAELYNLLIEKLDIITWRTAIERKLAIIEDIQMMYQHKTDATREDTLSLLVIILIFIELVIGLLNYLQ